MNNSSLKSFFIFVAVIALAGGGLFFLKNGFKGGFSAAPQNITVGNVKSSSVDISWITSSKTANQVLYGESRMLGKTAEVPGLGTAHLVTIESLKPNATYYFQIGGANSDQPFTFRTLAEVKNNLKTANTEERSQVAAVSPFGKILNNEPNKPQVLAEATESGTPTDLESVPAGTPETGSLGITLLTALVLSLFAGLGFKLLKN